MWPWFNGPYRRVGDAPLRNTSGVAIFVGDFRVMSFTPESLPYRTARASRPSELNLETTPACRGLIGLGSDVQYTLRLRQLMTPAFAEMIRTPHSRISFFMNKFRKLGYTARVHVRSAHLNVLPHD